MKLLFPLAAMLLLLAALVAAQSTPAPALHVGLRRSSYGLAKMNHDHAWWADRAKAFAANFPGARPTIIEIVSTYQEESGGTEFEFRPSVDLKPVIGATFAKGRLDHEKALAEYDAKGVDAILQIEPGSADVSTCLGVAAIEFGRHPCVVGLGIDAEWLDTKASAKKEGRPVTDAEAKAWMEKTLALNPRWTLFIKHFDPSHMPPTFRHPQLLFISDSQDFASREEWMKDFEGWQKKLKGAAVGYQFGYPKDKRWWSKLAHPPIDLATHLRASIPDARWLFWVDFTADQVEFR